MKTGVAYGLTNTFHWVRHSGNGSWPTAYEGWSEADAIVAFEFWQAKNEWVIMDTITDKPGDGWRRPYFFQPHTWQPGQVDDAPAPVAPCNPNQNPAPPAHARLLMNGEITPEIQAEAKRLADDGSNPIGLQVKKSMPIRGGKVSPLIFWVSCHSYTQIGDQQIPGAFHGVSVYVDLAPGSVSEETDWGMVLLTVGALTAVGAGFRYALKTSARK